MSANPHANGGLPAARPGAARLPRLRGRRGSSPAPRRPRPRACLGGWLRDVMRPTTFAGNFRVFGPDETDSNRLGALRGDRPGVDGRPPRRRRPPRARRPGDGDPQRAPLPGLARGLPADRPPRALQLLRGLHPHRRLDVQPAREVAEGHARDPWRRPIASLNYLLSSHVWRQDHNGFSHQDPGFIDHVVNKKAEIVRVYLPPDANCLLSVADHCLRSRDYVNVIVAGKQPSLDFLSMDDAITHCTRGIGIWDWASTEDGEEPDVVLALRRRHPDPRDARRGRAAARAPARAARPGGQRRGPDAPAARVGASARPAGRRVRRALHHVAAGDLRLPRLPVADPSPHLPADQPPQPARARLQGGGHHDHALRHGHAQRPRPLPPRDGRDRPRARARRDALRACASRWRTSACATAPIRASTATTRPTCATGPGPADQRARPRSPTPGRAASSSRCSTATTPSCGSASSTPAVGRGADGGRGGLAELPGPRCGRPPHRARRRALPRAVRLDAEVLSALARADRPRAAAPAEVAGGRRGLLAVLPDVPEVACFDTAFHATLPPAAAPTPSRASGASATVRRFGFHGLSHAYAAGASGARSPALAGSSPATSARAPRCARCSTDARSTRRWASRRSRAWRWRRAPARSTRACCSGSNEQGSTRRRWPTRSSTSPGWWGSPGRRTCARCSAPDDPDARLAFDVYLHRLRRDRRDGGGSGRARRARVHRRRREGWRGGRRVCSAEGFPKPPPTGEGPESPRARHPRPRGHARSRARRARWWVKRST